MRIHTLTAIVGTTACNAHCPYCVSRMTPAAGVERRPRAINERNFRIACRFAVRSGVSTLLLTGKGEPTLFPKQIAQFTAWGHQHFPFIELQTNGIRFLEDDLDDDLRAWYDNGMTLISLSIAHPDVERNAEIFRPGHPGDFWAVSDKLRQLGFSVRINCTLVKGYVDDFRTFAVLVDGCRARGIEQLTVREVARPEHSEDPEVAGYVDAHQVAGLGREFQAAFKKREDVTQLLELPHGAIVYDWAGQNVCLGNCLTETRNPEDIRQLIFFPDGHLRYSWQYEGAIIL